MLFQRLGGALAEILVGQLGAGGADDAGFRGHLAVAESVIQRRQQFSKGQVAGGAEDDAVEDGDGYDLRHPSVSWSGGRCVAGWGLRGCGRTGTPSRWLRHPGQPAGKPLVMISRAGCAEFRL